MALTAHAQVKGSKGEPLLLYTDTMFFHSNAILVHQTSKSKRVIAEPEGALAKSLKNVVVPEKSDSAPLNQ